MACLELEGTAASPAYTRAWWWRQTGSRWTGGVRRLQGGLGPWGDGSAERRSESARAVVALVGDEAEVGDETMRRAPVREEEARRGETARGCCGGAAGGLGGTDRRSAGANRRGRWWHWWETRRRRGTRRCAVRPCARRRPGGARRPVPRGCCGGAAARWREERVRAAWLL
ncbi:hypothetical protein PAHAL_5G448700 [Panicum hallii]|uniref:DUF834 domain-containing protein n=1 Tax=Panicum hallii TaxID=206008 RepID=A0A2T8INC4_9POAL|nr:hypothetical protein PAHAL_5G448700 [Panicum hallii]